MTTVEIAPTRPDLLALYRCDEDDEDDEQLVGWAMALPDGVIVTYVRCRDGQPMVNVLSSTEAVDRILGYAGIYTAAEPDLTAE